MCALFQNQFTGILPDRYPEFFNRFFILWLGFYVKVRENASWRPICLSRGVVRSILRTPKTIQHEFLHQWQICGTLRFEDEKIVSQTMPSRTHNQERSVYWKHHCRLLTVKKLHDFTHRSKCEKSKKSNKFTLTKNISWN